jgi:hypothetical protein
MKSILAIDKHRNNFFDGLQKYAILPTEKKSYKEIISKD